MKYVVAIAAVLLLIGCGGGEKPQAQTPPTDSARPAVVEASFAKDVAPIFAANCMPCHSGAADAKSPYDLSRYEGVMGNGKDTVPNVLAGRADSSLLYMMLHEGKMPPTGPLDAAKVATIKKWVDEGAKNN